MAERPIVVAEILGLPGTGKTTLAKGCALSGDVRVMSRHRSWSNVPAYSMTLLELGPTLTRLRAANICSWRACNKMVRLESSRSIVRRQARRGVRAFMFDQGPLFLLSELSRNDRSRSSTFRRWRSGAVDRWRRAFDVVIVLDAPNDVLLERIGRRGKRHGLQELAPSEARHVLDRERESFELLLDELVARGTLQVRRIDTSRAAFEATLPAIMTMLSPVAPL